MRKIKDKNEAKVILNELLGCVEDIVEILTEYDFNGTAFELAEHDRPLFRSFINIDRTLDEMRNDLDEISL